jgi:hypothetical protein
MVNRQGKLVKEEAYPKGFLPDHDETLFIGDIRVAIPAVNLTFNRWEGKTIQNTFGGKPIVEYHGSGMFADLAMLRMAVNDGWSARWVETYGSKGTVPYYFTEWLDAPLKRQIARPLDSPYHQKLLATIAVQNDNSYAGMSLRGMGKELSSWSPSTIRKIVFVAPKQSGRYLGYRRV